MLNSRDMRAGKLARTHVVVILPFLGERVSIPETLIALKIVSSC